MQKLSSADCTLCHTRSEGCSKEEETVDLKLIYHDRFPEQNINDSRPTCFGLVMMLVRRRPSERGQRGARLLSLAALHAGTVLACFLA